MLMKVQGEKTAKEKHEKSKSSYACTQTGECTHRQNYDFCNTFVFTYTEVNPTSQNTQDFIDTLC